MLEVLSLVTRQRTNLYAPSGHKIDLELQMVTVPGKVEEILDEYTGFEG